jgi:hypothetical protein
MKKISFKFLGCFLGVFKTPTDSNRVFIAALLALFVSHVFYVVYETPVSIKITNVLIFMFVLAGLKAAFVFCWCLFSGGVSPKLATRVFIVSAWVIVAHRLYYGVEQLGTPLFNALTVITWVVCTPYALLGLTFEEIHSFLKRPAKEHNENNKIINGAFK